MISSQTLRAELARGVAAGHTMATAAEIRSVNQRLGCLEGEVSGQCFQAVEGTRCQCGVSDVESRLRIQVKEYSMHIPHTKLSYFRPN